MAPGKNQVVHFQEEEVDGNIGVILCATFEDKEQANLYRHVLRQ